MSKKVIRENKVMRAASEAYWQSIMITPTEYRQTLENKAHRHSLKVTKGYAGTFFYGCKCGFKSGELPFKETKGRKV